MKTPSRSEYALGCDFLAAMAQWSAASEAAHSNLAAMFDQTEASTESPDWVKRPIGLIANVCMSEGPFDRDRLEPALRSLSGYMLHRDLRPVRLCHGTFDGIWACFAEVEKAA